MEGWSFLTNHARVLLCIAHDPGVRLRDIAARVGITERSAFATVTDLTEAGYVVKRKDAAVTAIRFRRTSLCPSSQPRSAASSGRPNPPRPGPSGHWPQIVPQVKGHSRCI